MPLTHTWPKVRRMLEVSWENRPNKKKRASSCWLNQKSSVCPALLSIKVTEQCKKTYAEGVWQTLSLSGEVGLVQGMRVETTARETLSALSASDGARKGQHYAWHACQRRPEFRALQLHTVGSNLLIHVGFLGLHSLGMPSGSS